MSNKFNDFKLMLVDFDNAIDEGRAIISETILDEYAEWLIAQAELANEYAEKTDELHKFLQERKAINEDVSYWGRHVIDVLLEVVKRQEKLLDGGDSR